MISSLHKCELFSGLIASTILLLFFGSVIMTLCTVEVLNEDTIETVPNKQPAKETPTKDKNTTVLKSMKGCKLPMDLFAFNTGLL